MRPGVAGAHRRPVGGAGGDEPRRAEQRRIPVELVVRRAGAQVRHAAGIGQDPGGAAEQAVQPGLGVHHLAADKGLRMGRGQAAIVVGGVVAQLVPRGGDGPPFGHPVLHVVEGEEEACLQAPGVEGRNRILVVAGQAVVIGQADRRPGAPGPGGDLCGSRRRAGGKHRRDTAKDCSPIQRHAPKTPSNHIRQTYPIAALHHRAPSSRQRFQLATGRGKCGNAGLASPHRVSLRP